MAIPYSRPPAASPKTLKPLTLAKTPRAPKAPAAPARSAYDTFTLPDPYKPGTLQQTAHTGYNADVANATKLASMGTTPDSQIASDYAQRGANINNVYQGLQQQLAGIQTAQVAQGNAGTAALGAQNAAIGAPAGVLPTAGAQAVLGANTAATGNYGGSLQAAALSAGAQNQQHALDAGTLAQQTNDQNVAKTLASLLSGVDPVSTRLTAERTANQGVDASNLQTKLSLLQSDETAKTAAITAGDKSAYDQAVLDERRQEATMSNATKRQLGIAADQTRIATTTATQSGATARAKTAATARVKAAETSAAAKKAAAATAAAAKVKTAGGAGAYKNYKVTVLVPQPDKPGKKDPITGLPGASVKQASKRIQKTVPAAVWNAYVKSGPVNKRRKSILGIGNDSQVQASTGY